MVGAGTGAPLGVPGAGPVAGVSETGTPAGVVAAGVPGPKAGEPDGVVGIGMLDPGPLVGGRLGATAGGPTKSGKGAWPAKMSCMFKATTILAQRTHKIFNLHFLKAN